jgi:very-short-patch-repair endonuclease
MKKVKDIIAGWGKSDSPLEEKLAEAFRYFDLKFEQQYRVDVFFADFCFADRKLIVEVDGRQYHTQQRDDYRDKKLKQLGWRTERFPGWFVYRYPRVIAAKIAFQYYQINNNKVKGAIATYNALNHHEQEAVKIAEWKKNDGRRI